MLGLILNETEIVNNILEGKEKLPSNSGKIPKLAFIGEKFFGEQKVI